MKIPFGIRQINKKYTNRVMIKIAGKPHSPIALIRHCGRKSGNIYDTPIIAAKNGNHFTFALTYGKDVDWYRNVLARGCAELLWHGCWFELSNPQPLDANSGASAFPQPAAVILGWIRIEDYFQMEITGSK